MLQNITFSFLRGISHPISTPPRGPIACVGHSLENPRLSCFTLPVHVNMSGTTVGDITSQIRARFSTPLINDISMRSEVPLLPRLLPKPSNSTIYQQVVPPSEQNGNTSFLTVALSRSLWAGLWEL